MKNIGVNFVVKLCFYFYCCLGENKSIIKFGVV